VQVQSRTGAFGYARVDGGFDLSLQDGVLRKVFHANAKRPTLCDDKRDLLGGHRHRAQVQRAARSVQCQMLRVIAPHYHNRLVIAKPKGSHHQIEGMRELIF
jgi:hypothetical protein